MKCDINSISELVKFVSKLGKKSKNLFAFRGERKDYKTTALMPFVYRDKYIENEDRIFRESQRFNDTDFGQDVSTFDRLSRIQHYSAPTRLVDVSEDLFSAIFFAIAEKETKQDLEDALIYIFEIDKDLIKYYDSDTVSVISNLAKIPLRSNTKKSKEAILDAVKNYSSNKSKFNKEMAIKYLIHEIKNEKPYFSEIIEPKHITSVQFVLPKFTNNRIRSQKGAFLLFGLNPNDFSKPIPLLDDKGEVFFAKEISHPFKAIHIANLKNKNISKMQKELLCLGIRKPFIYPEIDRVSEFLKNEYK